ncbi:MAG: DUF438 domain-containing protein [Bacteroidetes bacterium]|nr:DUF438 domain-containing protein [Bacteroidota bacterium]
MSELINNSQKRKELLKHMILQLHEGEAPEAVRERLIELMKKVPYGDVVEVEQELISEGALDEKEVLKFCDMHTQALEGAIDQSGAKEVPVGHPVDVFLNENKELLKVINQINKKLAEVTQLSDDRIPDFFQQLKGMYHSLMDVDKHYRRKENLLFPYLENYGITGPPTVMWGKHDETRTFLKGAIETLNVTESISVEEVETTIEMILTPALNAVADMTMKEEEILFPMCMDKLTDIEWYEIQEQTLEIGFCLYDPSENWNPEGIEQEIREQKGDEELIQLPSGSFTKTELQAILNSLPIDMTFVDKNEKVKYFSQSKERIFDRNRAILNRDVKLCHPPSSVGIVEKILDDFSTGKETHAPFWIQMGDKFVHIEYVALKDEKGNFLGTLEISQNLTEKRKLEGDQRLLSYVENN